MHCLKCTLPRWFAGVEQCIATDEVHEECVALRFALCSPEHVCAKMLVYAADPDGADQQKAVALTQQALSSMRGTSQPYLRTVEHGTPTVHTLTREMHDPGEAPTKLKRLCLLQSRMQTEEPAAEGAAQSDRPSKQEQPYSASRVSTLAAHLEQARAGHQVAAGHPAGGHLFQLRWNV